MNLPPAITISLPIPDRALSPNAGRGQSRWAAIKKSRIVKEHRNRARLRFLSEMSRMGIAAIPADRVAGYSLDHYFKTAAFRDDDNADGACKAYRDGIADALGIDDRHLRKTRLSSIQKDKDAPRVEITLYLKNQTNA